MDKPPPPPHLVQNSIKNAYKSKDHYPRKAKGMSFFAFAFSVLLYISIIYIFNLSPSNLVNNTKFWFFISNTLVIIIAVDYGSYSSTSSKHNIDKHDLYDEYLMRRQRSSVPSIQTSYREINKARNIPKEEEEEEEDQAGQSSKKREEVYEVQRKREQHYSSHRRKLSIVPKSEPLTHSVSLREKKLQSPLKCNVNEGSISRHKNMVVPTTLQRSQSEIAKRVVIDESKNIVRRIETEKYEPSDCDEAKNDYANMSNEELNRRVEEFIEKFNQQIRLQGEVYSK